MYFLVHSQIVRTSTLSLDLRITLPALSEPGNFTGQIDWYPSRGEHEEYPWQPLNFTTTVVKSQPRIVQLQPSQASELGGDIVQVLVNGFPPTLDPRNLSVFLGGVQCSLASDPVSDLHGAVFSFHTLPKNISDSTSGLGLQVLDIQYQSKSGQGFMFAASTHFLIFSAGFGLACVEGCVHSLGRRSTNATLEFTLSGHQAMSYATEIDFDCKLQMGNGFDQCKVWNFSIDFVASCQTKPSPQCFKIYIQYGLDKDFQFEFEAPTPFTLGYIVLRNTKQAFSSLYASVRFQRAPRVTSAVFSSNWATIHLSFDQSIMIKSWPRCTLLSETEMVGIDSSCLWSNTNNFIIVLGYKATILPGDTLEVSKNLSDISGSVASSKTQKIIVRSPLQVQQPEISVFGPRSVSKCDAAELLVQTTSSRNQYKWGCMNDNTVNRIVSRIQNSTLVLEGKLLELGKTYFITVQIMTYYGMMSTVAVHSLELSATPIPISIINLPVPPYINSKDMLVEGSATFSKCAAVSSNPLKYLWQLTYVGLFGGNSSTNIVLQSFNPTMLIPANTLKANQEYQLTLTAETDTQLPGKSALYIKMQGASIAAVIVGGNTYIHRSANLVLDGSQSVDPDDCLGAGSGTKECASGKALAFQWNCFQNTDDPCRFKNGSVILFARSSKFHLDLNILSSSRLSGILISLIVSKSGKADQQNTSIYFSADPTINAQLKLLYFTETRVAFEGLSSERNFRLSWTLIKSSVGEPLDTSDTSVFLTGISSSNFIFRLDRLLDSNAFFYGDTFRVILDVFSNSGRGKAWLDLVVPIPPTGGVCAVSPLQGIPLNTIFNVECKDWQGSALPLTYSFSASPSYLSPTDSAVTWTPPSSLPKFSICLPEGNYSIATKIMDDQGFHKVVSSAIIQVHSDQDVDLKSMDSVFDQYNSVSKTSQILMLVDTIANNLNAASGSSCSAGVCRRLLGSSKAYRMSVRRLLLKKLSGSVAASISSHTAPSTLKATKRVASVSSELNLDALDAAKNQIASFQFLDVKVLQSGGIIDIMKLSATLLASAVPKMGLTSLDLFNLQIMESILILSHKYLLGMLEGEVPLSVHLSDLSMDIIQSNQMADPSDLIFIPSVNMSRRAMKYYTVGCGVVRLGPGFSAQADGVQQHMLGIAVLDLNKPTRSGMIWSCPHYSGKCIQLGFTFKGFLNLYSLNITLLRWKGNKWIDANCTINAVVQEEQYNVVANFSCDSDGLYKAMVFSPLDMSSVIRPFRICTEVDSRVVSSWAVLSLFLAAFLFSIGSGTGILLIYKRVSNSDMDSFTSPDIGSSISLTTVTGNWFQIESATPDDKTVVCSDQSCTGVLAHHTKFIHADWAHLSVSASLSFPVGRTNLVSVQPPIIFLDNR
jgi:hypothetical protein